MKDERIEALTAYAAPMSVPDTNYALGERDIRRWMVRCAKSIAVTEHGALLTERACSAVATARRAHRVPSDEGLPEVTLVAIGDEHVIVRIASITAAEDVAAEYLVAVGAALSALEELTSIYDIQGIPRRYWRLILGSEVTVHAKG